MDKQPTHNTNNDDVDILQLLKLIGQGIKSIFQALGAILHNLYVFIISVLLFFKRNFVYLVASVILGFVINQLHTKYNEAIYEAKAIIEPNFDIELEIKSRLEDFNQLIGNKDTIQLADMLNISASQAANLRSFEIEPIEDLNNIRKKYYEYIGNDENIPGPKLTFDEYLQDISFEDYSEFSIIVESSDKSIFGKLGSAIWDFSNDSNVQKRQQMLTQASRLNKKYLENSLNSLDSTRITQRKVMLSEANRTSTASTSIDLGNKESFAEQPQLYEYERLLRQEIVDTSSFLETNKDIVIIVKGFPQNGTKKLNFIGTYAIPISVIFVVVILLLIRLIKYLNRIEEQGTLSYKKI